jgi:signal transduction histidine kinase
MNNGPVHVLVVEDNPADAASLLDVFARAASEEFRPTHLSRLDAALVHLSKSPVDVVVIDQGLPDATGLLALQRLHAAAPSLPVVVLSGGQDFEVAVEALRQGAQDYLVKGSVEDQALPRSVRFAMERHRLFTEADLVRKRQLQVKDEFFSHVSHELRSPLTAIYEFASILVDGIAGECNACQRGYLNIVLRNASQLESMIDDLLEVTRAETGKLTIEPQRTSLQAIVQEAMETVSAVAAANHLKLCSQLQTDAPPVYADPVRLRQVFLNLLNNAIKFTPDQGTVTVRTETSAHHPKHMLASVADTGCGIPADAVDHIFERLYQSSDDGVRAGRKGLGLGLYISKELIHRQAGNIWVESELGKGSTFFFTTPIFSVADILAPILNAGRLHESLALICVSLTPRTSWSSPEARSAAVRSGLQLLRRCVLPDLDLVLPQMEFRDGVERLFIVAMASMGGVEILVKRIHGQLERAPELQDPSFTWQVSWQCIAIPKEFRDLPDSEYCVAVADLIIEQVDRFGMARSTDEQKENSNR